MSKQDLLKKVLSRPFSWSQFSSFRDYDKEKWYQNYVLGFKEPPNAKMMFGSKVGKCIETDPSYIPQLPRATMEYELKATMKDIELIGFADSYDPKKKELDEFKTGTVSIWNQKKVDNHDQLTFYALLLYLRNEAKPEDITIRLHHMVTEEKGDFSIGFAKPFTLTTYATKRTTKQVLMFASEIIRLRKEMEEYILTHE
ncbi:MAG TPA: hypothetical protein PKO16_09465 [Bacteroidia bacterium]|nr:hypothetical protein [Bacteroidia bacterium]